MDENVFLLFDTKDGRIISASESAPPAVLGQGIYVVPKGNYNPEKNKAVQLLEGWPCGLIES